MKFYLGIKFHEDLSNKGLIERICHIAEKQNNSIICDHRDLEHWGEILFSSKELMQQTFEIIENCDAVIIEFSESGVGIGIEVGYAVARNIPVYVLLPKGNDISPTIQGVCKSCYEYETDEDLHEIFNTITAI